MASDLRRLIVTLAMDGGLELFSQSRLKQQLQLQSTWPEMRNCCGISAYFAAVR